MSRGTCLKDLIPRSFHTSSQMVQNSLLLEKVLQAKEGQLPILTPVLVTPAHRGFSDYVPAARLCYAKVDKTAKPRRTAHLG